jgi:hypothetical protein
MVWPSAHSQSTGPTLTGHSEQPLVLGYDEIYLSARDVLCSPGLPCSPRTRDKLLTGTPAAPAHKAAGEPALLASYETSTDVKFENTVLIAIELARLLPDRQ